MDRVRDIFFIVVLFGAFISFSSSSPIDSSINDLESNDIVQPTVNADASPVEASEVGDQKHTVNVDVLSNVVEKKSPEIISSVEVPKVDMEKPIENAEASAVETVEQPQGINSPIEAPKVELEKSTENAIASADAAVKQQQEIISPAEASEVGDQKHSVNVDVLSKVVEKKSPEIMSSVEVPKVDMEKPTENAKASAVATVEQPQETNSTPEIPNTEIVMQPGKEEQQEKPDIEESEEKEKLDCGPYDCPTNSTSCKYEVKSTEDLDWIIKTSKCYNNSEICYNTIENVTNAEHIKVHNVTSQAFGGNFDNETQAMLNEIMEKSLGGLLAPFFSMFPFF